MTGRSFIHYYAESLGHGRGILRVDVVHDDQLVESHEVGSPAPIQTVRKHERTIELNRKRDEEQ